MISMLETGTGFWNPILWLIAFSVIAVIILYIRSLGREGYKKGSEQTMVFFSGNLPPEKPVKSSNVYWGFFEATKRYYKVIRGFHTGIVNDYVYIFIIVLVALMLSIILGV